MLFALKRVEAYPAASNCIRIIKYVAVAATIWNIRMFNCSSSLKAEVKKRNKVIRTE